VNTAMDHRAELAQQQLRVASASTVLKVAKNNLLPQLNFVGRVGLQSADSTLDETLEQQADANHWNYRLGLQLEIPIGNRAARAIYERSRLQRQQAIEQYANVVAQVSEDVKTALRNVQTAWDETVATHQATFAATDALRAIQQQQENNEPLTPNFVQLKLDRQAELAQAEQAESSAIATYNTAIAQLEQAKGTLLRYNNVLLAQDRMPTVKPYRGQ
jgi:outer membrane protein